LVSTIKILKPKRDPPAPIQSRRIIPEPLRNLRFFILHNKSRGRKIEPVSTLYLKRKGWGDPEKKESVRGETKTIHPSRRTSILCKTPEISHPNSPAKEKPPERPEDPRSHLSRKFKVVF